jgi:hypothetical protein
MSIDNPLKESAESSAGRLALQCAGLWTGLLQILNEAER